MSASAKLSGLMTVDEFLVWEPDDPMRYELMDGEPVAMAPTSNVHGVLQSRLGRLIGNHLEASRPGCEVLTNPGVIPKLRPKINFRIPDLGVTCATIVPTASSLPDPVLLVEILSPSNQSDTMMNVWAYTSIPSVREILILRSDRRGAEVLRRLTDGGWPSEPEPVGATLDLESIGFSVPMADLYARTGLTG